jgi:O-antigen chain-terminating methyltransferase
VLKPFLARVFARVARLFGIPEIQHRLDHADAEIRNLRDSHRTDPRFGTLERHLERRTQQQITDQAAHTQQQLADQAAHTQALAQQLQQQQLQQHAQLTDLRQLLNEAQQSIIASTTAHLESVVNAVQSSLIATTTHHTEQVVNEVRAHLETELNVAKRDLDNLRRMASTQSPTASASPTAPQAPVVIDDALYISLEDHFRGDKTTVQKRQMDYLPYISGIVSEQFPLIDLGCGRGEWLQVLKDNHLAARGIDSNTACVAECTENGLTASLGELLDTLSQLPDDSCGSITMFQVLEHLPFDVVVNVLREARRVLVPGGVFIGEVPNSETLRVGASTFWIDPTHQRPLFPAVLAFLASSVGFAGVTGKYSSPLAPTPDLTGLPDNATKTILDLHHAINGPGDFALIATA